MYHNLTTLNKNFKIFLQRCIKEASYNNEMNLIQFNKIIKYIRDTINHNMNVDDAINDVIDMILKEGDLDINEFIMDVNTYIKCINNEYVRYLDVRERQDLIIFFKKRMKNTMIFKRPLYELFTWSETINGYDFYQKLDEKIKLKLKKTFNIFNYISELQDDIAEYE
jgi:hypothetical protein